MSQKEQSNSVKGIFLRDKATEFIASLILRYGEIVTEYCMHVMTELSSQADNEVSREAKYQVVRVWLKSSSDQDNLKQIFDLISKDLEGNSLIVKARAIQLLSVLADSEALLKQPDDQERFVKGIL